MIVVGTGGTSAFLLLSSACIHLRGSTTRVGVVLKPAPLGWASGPISVVGTARLRPAPSPATFQAQSDGEVILVMETTSVGRFLGTVDAREQDTLRWGFMRALFPRFA